MRTRADYKYDLFVSFASDDEPWVSGYLLPALHLPPDRVISHKVLDLSQPFRVGVPQVDEFDRAVEESWRTLVVFTQAYLTDRVAKFGEQLASSFSLSADEDEPRLVPLLLKPCALPPHVKSLKPIDCIDEESRGKEVDRLRALLGAAAPVPEDIPCPYPGMRPFTKEDARFFYGREAQIDELLLKLRSHNFFFVIGPSGCGKSSLVTAGLLPRLDDGLAFARAVFRVRVLRPGEHPMEALRQALGGDPLAPSSVVDALLAADPPKERLLLFIDQFEEVFSLASRDEQRQLCAALVSLRKLPERRCTLLITLRADFYQDLMSSDLWPIDPAGRLELAPLRNEALREALRRPAEDLGVYLEAGLVEQLLQDAAEEPGVLPLLQETMVLLWGKRDHRLLTLRSYKGLGREGQSGLAVALAAKADGTLAELDSAQQALARRILVRLVQFGAGRTDTRRRQPEAELRSVGDDPRLFAATLRHLTDNRLLTLSGDEGPQGGRLVDLSHEALIAGWPRFGEWLRERRQAEQERRRLEAQAAAWVKLDRKGGLLDEVELGLAQRWLASAASQDLGHSPELLALLQASQAELDGARRRDEEAREKERRQARLLAERLTELYQEHARLELQRGSALTALVYLSKAYSEVGEGAGPILRTLLHEAARPADALRRVLVGHEDEVYGVAFNHDGKRIVTASWDNTARVWDAESGELLRRLVGHEAKVYDVAFSPDGTRIVTASWDKTARVWDAESGAELHKLEGHGGLVYGVAFSPDGTRIVTANMDKGAWLWDAESGAVLHKLEAPGIVVFGVAFSPDGRRLVTANSDSTAWVWDAESGAVLRRLERHLSIVTSVAFSPDGKRIATASWDKTALVWEAESGKLLRTLDGHRKYVSSVAFSPDGARIVTASWDKTARVWDAGSGQALLTLEGHGDALHGVAFSRDGKQIVTASSDKTARVWDAGRDRLLRRLVGHGAAFSPDGARIVTASSDSTAQVWDAGRGVVLAELKGHEGAVTGVAFCMDGKRVATASWDKTARVWAAESGEQLLTLPGHGEGLCGVAFSPDGKRIVTASRDKTARVWEAESGELLRPLTGHEGVVYDVAFSADGARIATASEDKTARIWEAESGRLLRPLEGHGGGVNGVAFSVDGARIVTASGDTTARVWDAGSGQHLLTLEGHELHLYGAAFSPDGTRIVTASGDATARVWDAKSGQHLLTLAGHESSLNGAAFSPDGARVVTASADQTARVWDVGLERRSPEDVSRLVRGRALHQLDEEGRLLPATPLLDDGR